MSTTAPTAAPIGADALVERAFEALIGSLELASMHVGERLGLYAALDDAGPSTSGELAARAGVDERYAREWLEQQAVAGVLSVDDPAAAAGERRYAVPAEHREPLLDRDSPLYLGAMPQLSVGMLAPIEQMIQAFRTGEGVPYADYGADTREGIAAFNRPMFVNELAQSWFPAIPEVDARLRATAGRPRRRHRLRHGWSSVVDRPRLPVRARGRLRRRRRRRSRPPGPWRPSAAWRTGCASSCRTRATRGLEGDLRPGHDLRGAPRHGPPRRGPAHARAACWPRAAA